MSYPIQRLPALGATCLLLLCATQALAGDEATQPQVSAAPVAPKPTAPAAAAALQHPKPYIDHELSNAEKAALAKQRMKSCRLHPGSCEQGSKDKKPRSKPPGQAQQAPEKADQ